MVSRWVIFEARGKWEGRLGRSFPAAHTGGLDGRLPTLWAAWPCLSSWLASSLPRDGADNSMMSMTCTTVFMYNQKLFVTFSFRDALFTRALVVVTEVGSPIPLPRINPARPWLSLLGACEKPVSEQSDWPLQGWLQAEVFCFRKRRPPRSPPSPRRRSSGRFSSLSSPVQLY